MASTATINIKVDSGQATKSVNELNKQVTAAAGSSASLRTELKKIVLELQTLDPSSARFKELSTRAGELKDQIADTNAVVGQLAGNFAERLTRGITGAVQIGIAGFQALSAAQALFGTENEDVNRTLVQMNALLNLSQAIETFAGIDQKIVEIKAAFSSLVGVQETQVVVTEAQATAQSAANIATNAGTAATGGLTTATTALGVAMKALPIIGLVASLSALGYAAYQYFSSSKKAEEQEKQRKKHLEELKKEQDDFNKSLVDETGGFLLLTERIKTTNAGTQERTDLLKQLNKEYGINLQNISDETVLLNQLDTASQNYINYQKTKLLLAQNQDKFNKYLQQSIDSEKELKKAQDAYAKNVPALNEQLTKYGDNMGAIRNQINQYQSALDKATSKNDRINKSLQNLTKNANTYNKTLTELNKTVKSQAELDEEAAKKERAKEEAQRRYQEYLRKYADIRSQIKDMEQKAYDAETALLQQRDAAGEITVDLVEREREARLKSVKEVYEATKKSINDTITDRKKRDAELKKLDAAYTQYTTFEEQQRLERTKQINEQIIEEQKKLFGIIKEVDMEKLGEQINRYQEDEKLKAELRLKSIEKELEDESLSLKERKKLLTERISLTRTILDAEFILNESARQTELKEQKKALLEKYQANGDYLLKKSYDEKGNEQYTIELTKQGLKEKEQLRTTDEVKYQEYLDNLAEAEKELNAEIGLIQEQESEEYARRNKENADKIVELTKETNEEIKEDTINTYMEIGDAIANIFNQVSSLISEFSRQNMEKAITQLNDTTKLQQEQLDQQLAQQLITREEYDNKVAQLNQQQQQKELQIKRKNFRTEKALNIVGATIDGARAVLSAFANTTGGIVIKSIAAALAGVFAATQIALIARQEFKAAKGGIVPGDGSGDIDTVPSRLAPGEAVINSRSTEQFLPLLSAVNELGGGRSLMPDLPASSSSQKFQPVFSSPNQQTVVKAYVVESELSQVQKRINRIERSTSF